MKDESFYSALFMTNNIALYEENTHRLPLPPSLLFNLLLLVSSSFEVLQTTISSSFFCVDSSLLNVWPEKELS